MLWVLLSSILMGIFYLYCFKSQKYGFRFPAVDWSWLCKSKVPCILHIPSNTLGHHLSIVPLISLLQMRCSTHISCEASLFWHFASFSGPEKKFWEMFPMIWWSTQNNEDSSMPLFHCFNDGWWCWCFHTWLKIIQHTDFFDTIMGWWQWQHLDYWRETFFWGCHRK